MDWPRDVLPVPGGPTNLSRFVSIYGGIPAPYHSQEDGPLYGLACSPSLGRLLVDSRRQLCGQTRLPGLSPSVRLALGLSLLFHPCHPCRCSVPRVQRVRNQRQCARGRVTFCALGRGLPADCMRVTGRGLLGRLTLGLELLEPNHCEVLDQPLLDLLEPIVVFVQLFTGVLEERAIAQLVRGGGRGIRRRGRPRDRGQPFKLNDGIKSVMRTESGTNRT